MPAEESFGHRGDGEDGQGRHEAKPPDDADEQGEESVGHQHCECEPAAERARGPHDLDDHRQMGHDERRPRECFTLGGAARDGFHAPGTCCSLPIGGEL